MLTALNHAVYRPPVSNNDGQPFDGLITIDPEKISVAGFGKTKFENMGADNTRIELELMTSYTLKDQNVISPGNLFVNKTIKMEDGSIYKNLYNVQRIQQQRRLNGVTPILKLKFDDDYGNESTSLLMPFMPKTLPSNTANMPLSNRITDSINVMNTVQELFTNGLAYTDIKKANLRFDQINNLIFIDPDSIINAHDSADNGGYTYREPDSPGYNHEMENFLATGNGFQTSIATLYRMLKNDFFPETQQNPDNHFLNRETNPELVPFVSMALEHLYEGSKTNSLPLAQQYLQNTITALSDLRATINFSGLDKASMLQNIHLLLSQVHTQPQTAFTQYA